MSKLPVVKTYAERRMEISTCIPPEKKTELARLMFENPYMEIDELSEKSGLQREDIQLLTRYDIEFIQRFHEVEINSAKLYVDRVGIEEMKNILSGKRKKIDKHGESVEVDHAPKEKIAAYKELKDTVGYSSKAPLVNINQNIVSADIETLLRKAAEKGKI